jgi:AAA+ ATPase superfamily predicted ATPase
MSFLGELSMFVGRKQELAQLKRLLNRPSASLIVIRGRRRMGKSRLIKEFTKSINSYSFMGLAPTETTTAKDQRAEFIRQFKQ